MSAISDPQGVAELKTTCRFCLAGCGTVVRIEDGDRVVGVRGDKDHVQSRGYMCPKGPQLVWSHNRPDRLNHPRIDGARASWDATLDDLARRIERAIARNGPDAFGTYTGTGCDLPVGVGFINRLVAALGSKENYSPLTMDIAPTLRALELVTGYAGMLMPFWDHDDEAARLLIVVGSNHAVSHGYAGAGAISDAGKLWRGFQARGGKIWTFDPVVTRSAATADEHIQPLPGTDPVILAWLAKRALERLSPGSPVMAKTKAADRERLRAALTPFELPLVAHISGVHEDRLRQLDRDIEAAGRIVFPGGTGLSFGPHGVVGEWLRLALLILTDSLEEPGGMWFDPGWLMPLEKLEAYSPAPEDGREAEAPASRPDLQRFFGQTPLAAMSDEIEHGPLRCLLILGGNPLMSMPNPERSRRALGSLDALAVIDVVESSLSGITTHMLPTTAHIERTELGGMLIAPNRPRLNPPLIKPVAERLHTWQIIGGLAQRLGVGDQVWAGLDPDTATEEDVIRSMIGSARHSYEELVEAGTNGVSYPNRFAWARERAVPEGKWRLAPPPLVERLHGLLDMPSDEDFPLYVISGRQDRRNNSTQHPEKPKAADKPLVRISPADAQALDIAEGDPIRVTSPHGTLTAPAAVQPSIREGVLQIHHAWLEANVCNLNTSTEVDPLTTQPQMTAFKVRIEREAQPAQGA